MPAFCSASAVALLACSAAHAQTAAAAPAAAPVVSLEEVVVTARRREERLQDVPAAVTAFNPEKLRQAQVTTARQLVSMSPSLNVSSGNQRDFQRFAIRGQGATVGAGESVTAYFAEAPMSQYIAGGPGLYFDLDNLQVLNGPQGTLFGRNTIGGAVLFTPKKPTNRNEGMIQAGYGNYNNREIAGVANLVAIPDVLSFRFSIDMRQRDGFTHQLSDHSQLDDINYQTYRASMLYKPTPWLENYTVFSATRSDTGGTGIILTAFNPAAAGVKAYGVDNLAKVLADQQKLGIRTTQGNAPHWWSTKTYMAVNTTTFKLPDNLLIKNVASWSRVSASGGFDNDGTPYIFTQWVREHNSGNPSGVGESRNDYVSEELQLQGVSLQDKFNWVVGGFWQNTYPYAFQDNWLNTGSVTITESHLNTTSTALFGQGTLDFGLFSPVLDKLKLTAGYRYSWDTRHYTVAAYKQATGACTNVSSTLHFPACYTKLDGQWEAPTYNLSLDYKLTPKILVYATTRTGFKSGGFNVNANSQIPTTFNPEKVKDYEAGIKADFAVFGRPVRANVDVFEDNYAGIQRSIFQVDPTNPTSTLTYLANAGTGLIRGLESEFTVKPTDDVTVDLTYSYLDAFYTQYPNYLDATTVQPAAPAPKIFINLKGRALPFSPKHKVGLNIRYDLPVPADLGKISVNGGLSYQGHFLNTDQVQPTVYQLGNYTLVNFGANWRGVMRSNADVELYVTNAFDKKAIAAGQVFYYSAGIAAASYIEPRMVGLRLRYHFDGN
jgi:iron complex outermembrane receptor protein